MKTPRDISGKEFVKALKVFDYKVVRQTGSHIMVTSNVNHEHHLAIPNHNSLKIGTLNAIVSRVAEHFEITKEEVMNKLFR
jgi:predicted RNA binding protein YcfA (HicA-like mRNA interferase family)